MQNKSGHPEIRDYGPNPFVFNIEHATEMNQNFRTVLWTGQHMQLVLMSIPEGSDIGAEMHKDVDQFLRIEEGSAKVLLGNDRNTLREIGFADESYAIIIPAGTWHNVINVGSGLLKLYSIYAPPQHPFGTVHKTKEDADAF